MTSPAERKRVKLAPRDLFFATHHQSAQAAVALVLGCQVDHLEVGMEPVENGWNLESVPNGDFETVCAAGYAMEVLLGRRPETAWTHCTADRTMLMSLDAARTGIELDAATGTARFMDAVETSRAILAHRSVRSMIDVLAESLSDAYLAGDGRLDGTAIREVSEPMMGVLGIQEFR